MTRDPDGFPDLTEAGEHALPASFFGLDGPAVHVLVGAGDVRTLPEDERRRVASFRSEKRRDEFTRGRTLLRRFMAERTGRAPEAIDLPVAAAGGFMPVEGKHHLSLTHTDALAAVALWFRPVGLDAERVRTVPLALSDRLLAVGEKQPDVSDSLLHVWTAKEAVLKATGHGLRGGLRRLHLDWQQQSEDLLLAQACFDGTSFRVSARRYCNIIWALAVPETGAYPGPF